MTQLQPDADGMETPTVTSHVLSDSKQVDALVRKLQSQLPYSIPLLRRIQFHLDRPISPTARIFVAAVVDRGHGEASDGVDRWLLDSQPRSQPWIAAHIDLINSGQTQVWLHASWESDAAYPLPSSLPTSMDALALIHGEPRPRHKQLLHALLTYISAELIPRLPTR